MSRTFVLRGRNPGPRVGLMAMLHGNEPAGLQLLRLLDEIGAPDRGEIHFIFGHPEAAIRDVRFIDYDLNRLFLEEEELIRRGLKKHKREYSRSLQLKQELKDIDILLDVHSTSAPSDPFVIDCNACRFSEELISRLSLPCVRGLDRFVDGTAIQWVSRRGGIGLCVEVGQHHAPESADRAYAHARRFLGALGMIDAIRDTNANDNRRIRIVDHVKKVGDGFRYRRSFENFSRLVPNEVIGADAHATYRAPPGDDNVIFMPASPETIDDKSNTDVFFIGKIS